MGLAVNDNIIERNKLTSQKCETVRQLKYVVDVLRRSRIKKIHATALLPGNHYDTPKYVVDV